MTNLDTLRDRYSNHFTGVTPDILQPTVYVNREAFIVTGADTLHQDTIGDSNVATVSEHLDAEVIEHHYHTEVVVWVDELENNDDLAGEVLEVMEALGNYPVFDDSHYCDLEYGRLQEYAADDLPGEIAYELGFSMVDEEETYRISEWIADNFPVVMEHNDGSVDDYPFNVKALAELYKG